MKSILAKVTSRKTIIMLMLVANLKISFTDARPVAGFSFFLSRDENMSYVGQYD